MRVGIVGSEEAKFTMIGRVTAQSMIVELIERADEVVSGGCHLGGVDIWAKELAICSYIPFKEFMPKRRSWSGGYRERNLQIAEYSDVVYCITVDRLPPRFDGMKFDLCYHCKTKDHVKSGGCWTVRQAIRMGKRGNVFVVTNV